jgi:hypothetical protein
MREFVIQFKGLSWHAWAASTLALLYVLPHLWWMFGVPLGFPGDSADFERAFDRGWFAAYNVITTVLVTLGAAGVVSLETRFSRPVVEMLVRIGAILLLLRGALGLFSMIPCLFNTEFVAASLYWELWFVVTGLVFFQSANSYRRRGDIVRQI